MFRRVFTQWPWSVPAKAVPELKIKVSMVNSVARQNHTPAGDSKEETTVEIIPVAYQNHTPVNVWNGAAPAIDGQLFLGTVPREPTPSLPVHLAKAAVFASLEVIYISLQRP